MANSKNIDYEAGDLVEIIPKDKFGEPITLTLFRIETHLSKQKTILALFFSKSGKYVTVLIGDKVTEEIPVGWFQKK